MKSFKPFLFAILLLSFGPVSAETVFELTSEEGFYVEIDENGVSERKSEKGGNKHTIKIDDQGVITSTTGADFVLAKEEIDSAGTIWLVGETKLAMIFLTLNLQKNSYIVTKTYTNILDSAEPLVMSQNIGTFRAR